MNPRIVTPTKSKRGTLKLPAEVLATLHEIARHYAVSQSEVVRQLIVRERAALLAEGWTPLTNLESTLEHLEHDGAVARAPRQMDLPCIVASAEPEPTFPEPPDPPDEPEVEPPTQHTPAADDVPEPILAPLADVPDSLLEFDDEDAYLAGCPGARSPGPHPDWVEPEEAAGDDITVEPAPVVTGRGGRAPQAETDLDDEIARILAAV